MPESPPLGLYIHIPWCARKCPYCDFNSHRADTLLPEQDYVRTLLRDFENELPAITGRVIDTIFIGGGTPSLFSAEAINQLLRGVQERARIAPMAEITLEANPGRVDSGKLRGFREAGVNRLSIGVQSFDPRQLQQLGRIHGREEALQAVTIARAAGFDNINLDLMFGLPGQTPLEALADIRTAIEQQPTHLSFYQLTLEPNTVFYKYPPSLPEEDTIWESQRKCQSLLAEHGYQQYEVSAYARDGTRCRHNVNYWEFGDYIGIGAGAHGKITDLQTGIVTRRAKIRHPQHYLDLMAQPERMASQTQVPADELRVEFLMNALRLKDGFDAGLYVRHTGLPLADLEPELSRCVEEGLLECCGGNIRCTGTGFNFLDTVLQRFIR